MTVAPPAVPPGYDARRVTVAELAPGDQLLAFDGHPLRVAREIAEGPARADGARRMVNPNEAASGVEWWVYPDQVDEILVARPRPAKPAPVPASDGVLAALARDVPRLRGQRDRAEHGWPVRPVGLGFVGDDVAVGDVVLIPDEYWRAGIVTAVGPKRVRVRSTSAYALDHAHPGVVTCREPYYPRSGSELCRAPSGGWTARARRIGAAQHPEEA